MRQQVAAPIPQQGRRHRLLGQYLVTIGVGTGNRLDDAKFPQVRHGRCVQRLRDDDYAHQGAEECADIHVQPYAGVGDPVVAGDVPPFGFAVDIVVGQAAAQLGADRRDVRARRQFDDDVSGAPGQNVRVQGLGDAIVHEDDGAGRERDGLACTPDDFQAVFHNFPVFADGKRAEAALRRVAHEKIPAPTQIAEVAMGKTALYLAFLRWVCDTPQPCGSANMR